MSFSSLLDSIRADVSTILGTASVTGAGISLLTGASDWRVSVPIIAGGIISALWPQTKTAPTVSAIATDLISVAGVASQAKGAVQALSGLAPIAGSLFSDASAVIALVQAAHASTPAGGSTTSSIVDGVASTTTTVPLAAPPVAAAPAIAPAATVSPAPSSAPITVSVVGE